MRYGFEFTYLSRNAHGSMERGGLTKMLHTRLETKAGGRTTRPAQVTRGLSEPRPMSVPCLVPAPRRCNPSTSGCACHSAHSQVSGEPATSMEGWLPEQTLAGAHQAGPAACLLLVHSGQVGMDTTCVVAPGWTLKCPCTNSYCPRTNSC